MHGGITSITPIEKLVSLLFRYGGELIPIFVLSPWVSFGQSVVGDLPSACCQGLLIVV